MKGKTILALSPHPDDVELGAGGALARWAEEGATIISVAFSRCRESVDHHKYDIQEEQLEAAGKLGLAVVEILDYPVRRFPEFRQAILQEMRELRERFSPSIVLIPCSQDIHQDHQVIHQEALRAFKFNNILGYIHPWNIMGPVDARLFVQVDRYHTSMAWAALQAYRSQAQRLYIEALYPIIQVQTDGLSTGLHAAIKMEVIRWII